MNEFFLQKFNWTQPKATNSSLIGSDIQTIYNFKLKPCFSENPKISKVSFP